MVRVARTEDAAAVAQIYAPYVRETTISFEEAAPTIPEMESRIDTTLKTLPWLVIEKESEVVGFAYAAPHRPRAGYRWSVDTAVYLHPDHVGNGHGRALYEALFPILVRQRYTAAYAGVALPNDASVELHEAMGFTPIGVLLWRGLQTREVGRCRLVDPRPRSPAGPTGGANPVSGSP